MNPKIAATIHFHLIHHRNGASLRENLFREDARKLVLPNHHLYIHAEVVWIAEHLDHTTNRRTRGSGPACDFYIDHQALENVIVQ